MSTLDIRQCEHGEIKEIQFDDSLDRIHKHLAGLLCGSAEKTDAYFFCEWKDLDNFIAACQKAKELWGPKE